MTAADKLLNPFQGRIVAGIVGDRSNIDIIEGGELIEMQDM